MNINWQPGHMEKARELLKTKLKIACFKRNKRIYNNNIMIILHQWNNLPKVINKNIVNFL